MQHHKSISTIRGILGLSIQEFAKKTGFSKSYISRIEKRERFPSDDAIKQIAQKLNISQNLFYLLASNSEDHDTKVAQEIGIGMLELLKRNDK